MHEKFHHAQLIIKLPVLSENLHKHKDFPLVHSRGTLTVSGLSLYCLIFVFPICVLCENNEFKESRFHLMAILENVISLEASNYW